MPFQRTVNDRLCRRDASRLANTAPGFASAEFLAVQVESDETDARPVSGARGLEFDLREIARRLEAEPGVTAVTFANLLPRMGHPQRAIEIEGLRPGSDSSAPPQVTVAGVDAGFFAALDVPVSGRAFSTADADTGIRQPPVVIVNETFVRDVLKGRQAIGRRIRYADAASPGEWAEIVGVVRPLAMTASEDPAASGAGMYYPLPLGGSAAVQLAVRVAGRDPATVESRVRGIVGEVNPALRLPRILPMDHVPDAELRGYAFWFRVLGVGSSLALLLSLAGIYSVTSFAVSRRTREIGIRVALGSDPRRVTAAVLARPVAQVGVGIFVGGVLVALLARTSQETLGLADVLAVGGYALSMWAVCLLACAVPTIRALRVSPTIALRNDS